MDLMDVSMRRLADRSQGFIVIVMTRLIALIHPIGMKGFAGLRWKSVFQRQPMPPLTPLPRVQEFPHSLLNERITNECRQRSISLFRNFVFERTAFIGSKAVVVSPENELEVR